MRRLIIISGILFTIGNVIWPLFGEPKLFFVPLAVFISLLIWTIKAETPAEHDLTHLLLKYLLILSFGNIIKQIFYTETIKHINDYVFGAIVTVWLVSKLFNRWAINTKRTPGPK